MRIVIPRNALLLILPLECVQAGTQPPGAPSCPTWGISSLSVEIISLSASDYGLNIKRVNRTGKTQRYSLECHSIRKNEIEEYGDQDQIGEHNKSPPHIVPNHLSFAAHELAG